MGKSSKVICSVIGVVVAVVIGLAIYLFYITSNASVPDVKFTGSQFDVARNATSGLLLGVTGNTTMTVTNNNKIAITINGASFPAYWPANASGTQVGSMSIPSATIATSQTKNVTLGLKFNTISPATAAGIALQEAATNASQFLVNGTTSGSAAVLIAKGTVSISFVCYFTISAVNGNSSPNCTYTPGGFTFSTA
eukprot:TRINITY_DN3286_c0_g1_i1.p1 TRINITY_DN3286_c0_g1~~TRINITY_DN3286_c0_g1_i1.p1  ORF type:complete len:195 (+),score=42.36 TRINITY_DN3286_c0_g1_i1:33-617(+)